ncbi:MAG TPA: hypothetical protein VJN18_00085 [Polyangiaceae bacterium]|nr:hypothetical protein [Polyangiaceae bacterium]
MCRISGTYRAWSGFWPAAALALGGIVSASCSIPDLNPSDTAEYERRPTTAAGRSSPLEPAEPLAAELPEHRPERALLDRDIDWRANSIMQVLGDIARTVKYTEYSHGQRVNVREGIYVFDCSSMAHWVLKRAAPIAATTAARGLAGRPLAADYQRRIASIEPGEERGGWKRIGRVEDAEPGDVVAWLKPKIIESPNTGHVAFIVLPPTRVTGYSDAYLVRVVDATSLLHADDTRTQGSGFGLGTILLVTESDGAPRAYGWVGIEWRAFETSIAIGRPTR